MKQLGILFGILIMFMTVIGVGAADATDLISYRFTGTVTEIDNGLTCSLDGIIALGDDVQGILTYDLDTPDTEPDPSLGAYQHSGSPSGFIITVNGHVFEINYDASSLLALVINSSDQDIEGPMDGLLFSGIVIAPDSLGLDFSCAFTSFSSVIQFIDSTLMLLSSDDLVPIPTGIWDDSDSSDSWVIIGNAPSESLLIKYSIDTYAPCTDEEAGLCTNGIDDDCDGLVDRDDTDDCPPSAGWSTASVVEAKFRNSSDITNYLFLLFIPIGAVIFLRLRARKKYLTLNQRFVTMA